MDLSSGPLACRVAPTSMNCVVHWEIHGAYRAGVSGGSAGDYSFCLQAWHRPG
jgi:hypothetical protein